MSQCVGDTQQITPMIANFGGIQAFYDIAKGISDGLQSTPNSKTYNDLNNLLFDNGPTVSTSQVAKDMILNQIGDIIFWSIGFVFVLAAIVLFLTTAIWQCCYTCRPQGKRRTPTCGWILMFFLFTTFSLILTGVVLFNVAQTNLTNSIDQGDQYTGQISGDLNQVLTNGTGQISCEVSSTTGQMFSQLEGQMANYSLMIVDGTKNQSGFTALYNFDEVAYNALLASTITSGQQLIQDFTTINQGDECATTLRNYTAQINTIQQNLEAFQTISAQITPQIVELNKNFVTIQKNIQVQADKASQQMQNTQGQITDSLNSMNNMVYNFQQDMNNTINSLKRARLDIVTSTEYTGAQIGARLLINIPAGIALFFSALSMILIVYRIFVTSSNSNCAPILVLIGFYTTVLLAIIVILCSSALFVAGWLMSAGCVPIFQDNNYGLFHLINFTSPTFNGQQSTINAGDALSACQSPSETVFAAFNGQNFISLDSINSQLDLSTYQTATDVEIRQNQPPNFTLPTSTLWAQLNAVSSAYSTLQLFDLSKLCAFNSPDVASYMDSVNQSIQMTTEYLGLIDNLNQNSQNITNITVSINDQQFNQGQLIINGSINSLINNLQTEAFKCRPIVDIYNNGGNVICNQYGEPIHGLWASVGLTGLMTFILAVLLILSYRWLTSSGEDKEHKESTSWRAGSLLRLSSRRRIATVPQSQSTVPPPNHQQQYDDEDVFPKPSIRHLPRVQPTTHDVYSTPSYYIDGPTTVVHDNDTGPRGLQRNYSSQPEEVEYPTGRGLKRSHF